MAFPNRNNFYSYMYRRISPIVLYAWTVGNSKTYRFASNFRHYDKQLAKVTYFGVKRQCEHVICELI